ncbi:MAG: hypothetical protein M1383_03375 [Patescibacteria group bacterium]|nr:hypothetical protein [Patescibacteria group bacterium]
MAEPIEFYKEIKIIKERNKRVEADKAWEISWTRRIFIAIITYVVAGIWLMIIHESTAWLKALVPVAGYILSTLSLPAIKKWWISKNL